MTNTHFNELIQRFEKVYKKLPNVEKGSPIVPIGEVVQSWNWVKNRIDELKEVLKKLEKLDII